MKPELKKILFVLVCLSFLIFTGCKEKEDDDDTASTAQTVDGSSDWYNLYFSDPNSPTAGSYTGGPDEKFVEAMSKATQSLDIATYDLTIPSISNAIQDAHSRGVTVRVFTETDHLESGSDQREELVNLVNAGITVIGDGRSGLMHNKFTIIDGQEVWTGSTNYTYYGSYRNNNNLIRIISADFATNYSTEFEELWTGGYKIANTPSPELTIQGTKVEVFFSPDDGVRSNIIQLLENATSSIKFMAFTFTSGEIADVLVQRHQTGINVTGVFDLGQSASQYCKYQQLADAGIDVKKDGNSYKLHHKVFIIDSQVVITGSYNFTGAAETTNDENLIILHNTTIAGSFEEEFTKVYSEAN